MKNKKGFTLIELMAVLIILAIIALITTPIIANVIDSAKKNSYKRTAESYAHMADEFIINHMENDTSGKLSSNLLNYIEVDGQPASGYIFKSEDNDYMMRLVVNNYCYIKEVGESIADIKSSKDLSLCNYFTPESCFDYEVDSSTNNATITSYKCGYSIDENEALIPGEYTYVSIPSTLGGHNVTKIGKAAFSFASETISYDDFSNYVITYDESAKHGIYGVEFPDTLTEVGPLAFFDQAYLWFNTLNKVKNVGWGSFSSINYQDFSSTDGMNISFGEVETIGDYAFESSNIAPTAIDFKESKIISIGLGSFSHTFINSIIDFPDTLETIGDYAFYEDYINSITFTKNSKLNSIGQSAFSGTRINEIIFPPLLTTIGNDAFSSFPYLKKVYIDKNLTSIGENAFSGICFIENHSSIPNDSEIWNTASGGSQPLVKSTPINSDDSCERTF